MYIYKYFIVVFIDIPYILRSIAKIDYTHDWFYLRLHSFCLLSGL